MVADMMLSLRKCDAKSASGSGSQSSRSSHSSRRSHYDSSSEDDSEDEDANLEALSASVVSSRHLTSRFLCECFPFFVLLKLAIQSQNWSEVEMLACTRKPK